ncbi:MAG: glutamate--cysteine ligase [Psychrosphaera sp.]
MVSISLVQSKYTVNTKDVRKGCALTTIKQKLERLTSAQFTKAITNINRGIERESLRVNTDGKLSQLDHPIALGSALTHPYVTTDYSESLLELITPPSNNINTTYAQLQDVHKFVAQNIGDEVLWPMSMPCFINNEDDIRIAQFGSSNVGKMKSTYRTGLKNRYGSMMQAISGIHYNFSLPTEFWQLFKELNGSTEDTLEYQSSQYMHMVRNIKRFVWVVTYLYGSSPAMCKSFLKGRETGLDFDSFGKGSIFLPNATSLRMSDLGYTNSAQSELNIEYGSLTQYIEKLRKAIHTESAEYKQIGVKVDGEYKQLNHNILQIENELYAPVRPKQVAKSGEKPTDALANRGIMYVELRALDVNPFTPYGITLEQMHVLDVFLLYCLFNSETELNNTQQQEAEENQDKIVLDGRKPDLTLGHNGVVKSRTDWLGEIFEDFATIATWLDNHYGETHYSDAIKATLASANDPTKTLSGKLLAELHSTNTDNGAYGLKLAQEFKKIILNKVTSEFSSEFLQQESIKSLQKQLEVEQADQVDFDHFLTEYFKY